MWLFWLVFGCVLGLIIASRFLGQQQSRLIDERGDEPAIWPERVYEDLLAERRAHAETKRELADLKAKQPPPPDRTLPPRRGLTEFPNQVGTQGAKGSTPVPTSTSPMSSGEPSPPTPHASASTDDLTKIRGSVLFYRGSSMKRELFPIARLPTSLPQTSMRSRLF